MSSSALPTTPAHIPGDSTPRGPRPCSASSPAAPTDSTPAYRVSLRVDGQESSVVVPAGATILEAALDAGVPIETSCRVGDCGTCKLQLLQGKVHQAEAEGLTPEEEDEGYILTCISRPRSPDVVLVDDD